VSAREFQSSGFVDRVRAALTSAGLPPELLMLEVTESLLLRDDDRVWGDLHNLRAMGVKIAIDDFGTGYSALSYLRQVPLDVIKVDRLFIGTITSSPQQRVVFEGIVRLADTLGLAVVAEGIETATERELVTRAGCAFGQGFAFARPMPDAEVPAEIAGRHAVSA
jgi:EAL domain-containing protein (putative c-di-GMP-specific phosphodiesterase class I)